MIKERRRTGRSLATSLFANLTLGAAVLLGALAPPTVAEPSSHSDRLWRVVHDLCVPDKTLFNLPLPCVRVDLAAGYAVVPDPQGAKQLLLVPTRRVSGIEDPVLQERHAPNYWQDAWALRSSLQTLTGEALARDQIGLAINSKPGRSEEQLHIHVSCIRGDIAKSLEASSGRLSDRWSSLKLGGQAWRGRILKGINLRDNPFKLARIAADARHVDLTQMTMVLVGARLPNDQPGFYLLYQVAKPAAGDGGHGEFLLDKTCGRSQTGE